MDCGLMLKFYYIIHFHKTINYFAFQFSLISVCNMTHKAGFVNILGNPNVGKSTIMNALVGEKLSIITSKAQTTRHRILGIVNTKDYQLIYSDTPGILNPQYEMQKTMMKSVKTALIDADIPNSTNRILDDT